MVDCQNVQISYFHQFLNGIDRKTKISDKKIRWHSVTFRYATVKIILAEVFVRPGAGYLWSNDFARNRIGHLNLLGGFHIVLGIIDMVAPLLIRDSVGFVVYGGMTFC